MVLSLLLPIWQSLLLSVPWYVVATFVYCYCWFCCCLLLLFCCHQLIVVFVATVVATGWLFLFRFYSLDSCSCCYHWLLCAHTASVSTTCCWFCCHFCPLLLQFLLLSVTVVVLSLLADCLLLGIIALDSLLLLAARFLAWPSLLFSALLVVGLLPLLPVTAAVFVVTSCCCCFVAVGWLLLVFVAAVAAASWLLPFRYYSFCCFVLTVTFHDCAVVHIAITASITASWYYCLL